MRTSETNKIRRIRKSKQVLLIYNDWPEKHDDGCYGCPFIGPYPGNSCELLERPLYRERRAFDPPKCSTYDHVKYLLEVL